jgi:hypothetical protein
MSASLIPMRIPELIVPLLVIISVDHAIKRQAVAA